MWESLEAPDFLTSASTRDLFIHRSYAGLSRARLR
jgi:hypothetical protein